MIKLKHAKLAFRYARHLLREIGPIEVQALLTNACDLSCAYCRCPELKIGTLSTEQWKRLIRELASLGTMRIKFQGGEPTLRPDFRELSAEAKNAKMITAVITHGGHIARREDLLDYIDEVIVSLDSPRAEVHDHQRGAGTWKPAVRTLELARRRSLATFVVMVVTRENLGDLEEMLRFCERIGAGMHAQPAVFGRAAFDDRARAVGLSHEEILAMHERLATWKEQGRPLMFSSATYRRVLRWPDATVLTTPSHGPSRCMAGRLYFHIEANGDVWPCAQHGADFTPGNATRDGLVKALRACRGHNCGDCFTVYLNERKRVFALQPSAVLEIFRRG